jgi:hypothetical protein
MSHGVSATYGGMAHSVMESTAILTNLASSERRGESCVYPGATSRVVVRELLIWSPSVRLLEGWADEGVGGCTAAAVVVSHHPGLPQCRG